VYDISRRDTFNHCIKWLEEVRQQSDRKTTIALIGNKNDLPRREVSYEEGFRFAKENDLLFIETSARVDENVDEAFAATAREIYKNIQQGVYDLATDRHGIKIGMPMSIVNSYGSKDDAQDRKGRFGGCCYGA
jgi:Ras-related protein Rab-2A